jgi:hypothetical protein
LRALSVRRRRDMKHSLQRPFEGVLARRARPVTTTMTVLRRFEDLCVFASTYAPARRPLMNSGECDDLPHDRPRRLERTGAGAPQRGGDGGRRSLAGNQQLPVLPEYLMRRANGGDNDQVQDGDIGCLIA